MSVAVIDGVKYYYTEHYKYNECNKLILTHIEASHDTEIIKIPEKINNIPVKKLTFNVFYYSNIKNIKKLYIPYGITSYESECLCRYGSVTSDEWSSLEEITFYGKRPKYNRSNLPFYFLNNMPKLKHITIPKHFISSDNYIFANLDSLESVIFEGKKIKIGSILYKNCPQLKHIFINGSYYNKNINDKWKVK